MGSWSVYCGISGISITDGHDCVLLPLKENIKYDGYFPYIPATLPIFGKYNDYGGMEHIQSDENTKLIEKHFGISIDDFITFLLDGDYTYSRKEARDVKAKLDDSNKLGELEKWRFMFIDRKVYDFMTTYANKGYGGRGDLDYGNPKILELLGGKYLGEFPEQCPHKQKRFKYVWEIEGVEFHSDGTWLYCGQNSIHNFSGEEYSNLSDHINIPEDKLWIGEKTKEQLWKCYSEEKQMEMLLPIIGIDRSYGYMSQFRKLVGTNSGFDSFMPNGILAKYAKNIEKFGDTLAGLLRMIHNMHPFSQTFQPFVLYVTPQCGEFNLHQVILEKFAEINKSYCYNEDEE